MDELLKQRLDAIVSRLDALEARFQGIDLAVIRTRDELRDHASAIRDELISHTRQVEMRLTTEVHTVAGLMRDLKDWLRDRDTTQDRLKRIEERLAKVEEDPLRDPTFPPGSPSRSRP